MLWHTFFIWDDLDITNLSFVPLSYNNIVSHTFNRTSYMSPAWIPASWTVVLQMTRFTLSVNSQDPGIICIPSSQNHHASHHSQHYYFQHAHSYQQLTQPFHSKVYNHQLEQFVWKTLSSSSFPEWGAYTLISRTLTVSFNNNNTVTYFPLQISLHCQICPCQNRLYLMLLGPKNLQPLPLHRVSLMHATSTSL